MTNLPVLAGEFSPSTGNRRPWRFAGCRLLSWWDMERFSARSFFLVGNLLGILPESIKKAAYPERYHVDGNEKVCEDTKNHVSVWVIEVQKHCEEIDLGLAVEHCKRFLWRLERDRAFSDVSRDIEELKNRILDEMKGELFLHIPRAEAEFYEPVDAFGPGVSSAFPSIWCDVREAYTCYALDHPTASVFHLMRVLEVALVALGKVFGFSFSHTNWGPAIDQLESKIRGMGQDPAWKYHTDWKNEQEFYSQAVSFLGVTKDAWRNYTAHARGKFDQKNAKVMLMNVKLFMERISQRVSE